MAITKAARIKIFNLVQDIKKLLVLEVSGQLQQFYGIRPDGSILMVEQLPATESEVLHTARLLRQRIDYIKSNIPTEGNKDAEAVKQLVNEQAFSILNRFTSLRMAEERGIIKESIHKDYNSEGFQIFDSITGQGAVAEQYIRYKWYLHSIFDELAIDLPSLFDRFSPYALIFPSERAMRSLLTIINNEQVTMHREEGMQPVNLWREDETIGWIYQYYNSREEISEMRDASGAPRNSRELAVRNQFFTPRYVVQFLTDNSLGRIWYEMTKGRTELVNSCRYLIRRPNELFLDKGKVRPENVDDETDYIEHRSIKDPREIRMLDPACGSMHFGLYSFDLFEQIYVEAWDNHPELLLDLRNSITRKQYIIQIPEYIIRYNIHGVDIDPRALQIAALSLWLRAQKSFEKLNLESSERPRITKSNLVLAEAMPGNSDLLRELIMPLDAPMRRLVTSIWDLMKMAGETGLLLRIEEEIDTRIKEIADELINKTDGSQLNINADAEQTKAAEQVAFYATKKYRDSFLENAENEVLKILKQLAETATNGLAYQKLLFADDAARGIAFIELCRKKYDVVLMNPPFGATSVSTKSFVETNYKLGKDNLASVFVERMIELSVYDGMVGCISTRSIFYLGSFKNWRINYLIENNHLSYFVDFGSGVLDAIVETSAYIISKITSNELSVFYDISKIENKEAELNGLVKLNSSQSIYHIKLKDLIHISNQPFCYWVNSNSLKMFIKEPRFENKERSVRKGICTSDNFRYTRLIWELNSDTIGSTINESFNGKHWTGFIISEDSQRYFYDPIQRINWKNDGIEVKGMQEQAHGNYSKRINSESSYFRSGLSWSFRTARFEPHIIPYGSMCSSNRFLADFYNETESILFTCALWNSEYMDYCIKLSLEAISGNPCYNNGTVNQLPFPTVSKDLKLTLLKITIGQYNRIKEIYKIRETSLHFSSNEFINFKNISKYNLFIKEKFKTIGNLYKAEQDELNRIVYSNFNLSQEEIRNIKTSNNRLTSSDENKIFKISDDIIVFNILSTLVGGIFGRWDIRIISQWQNEWSEEDIFKARQHSPFLFGQKQSTLDLIFPEYHKEIENIWKQPYPITTLNESAPIKDVIDKLREVINYFWPETSSTIEFELQDHFGVADLEDIFSNPNKFFDIHLKDYSRNKRISPIYWPISTASGNYTIWLYYPKLTDQTIVAVINNYLQPQIDVVINQKKPLEINSNLDNKGLKVLKDLNDFEHELEEMKKELLRITALPYKPNHDDGVLITAAPLHNLFRHTKWRKATEDCWNDLGKGEYDWAHLAYSIWPDRVSKKCKKDLSMAIAHGLESICEIKPKETTSITKKGLKEIKVDPQLKIEG